MNKQNFLLMVLAMILASCGSKEQQVNFVLIQMDDLGWDDLGIHGNQILETPNLDRLAGESVQFNNYYVNPVCAPSRASLLTGRDFLRTGVAHVHGGKDFLNLDEITLAEMMKESGYATGMWGKWHSGTTKGYLPWERGFDEAYMARLYKHENSYGLFNGEEIQHRAWADEVIIDYAIDFIERNIDKPFFAYLPSMTCHEPLAAPDSLVQKYVRKGLSKNLAMLYAMVDYFDTQVQRLFDAVEEMGLTDHTVFIFMSDNGPAINNGSFTDTDRKIRYVNGLKGHKGNIWENGVRSPLFIKYGKHFKPDVIDYLADVTDILPSMLELAGIEHNAAYPALDGNSLIPLLEGKPPKDGWAKLSFNYANPGWPPTDQPWTPEGVQNEYDPLAPEEKKGLKLSEQIISVRQGPYKLLLNPDVKHNSGVLVDGYTLYNIWEDPREQNNLIEKELKLAEDLKTELKNWFSGILQSPHSFAAPVFIIGDEAGSSSSIPAKGPLRNSPTLKNTFMSLDGWSQVGEFAEYSIKNIRPGRFRVIANHSPITLDRVVLKLAVGQENISTPLQNTQTELGEIFIDEGETTLHIEISEAPGKRSEILIKSFKDLKLIRK